MFARFRRYFFTGLVVCLPVGLTAFLLVWIFNFADTKLAVFIKPYFDQQFGRYYTGLSIVIFIYAITLIGFVASNYFGKKIYEFFEKLILKLPFFRQVYPAIKEIALFLFSREKLAFKQVVIVEYPRKGVYSFGFLTNESSAVVSQVTHKDLCNVFIPSAPGPLTGYVLMVPKKEIIFSDISVEDTIKFIVSGGVLNPSATGKIENG